VRKTLWVIEIFLIKNQLGLFLEESLLTNSLCHWNSSRLCKGIFCAPIRESFLTTFSAWTPLEQVKLKTGPGWLNFAPETYLHSLWCSSYRF